MSARSLPTLLAVVLAVTAAVAPAPAAAQDTTGWLYVSRGGDIIAMRPDGSGQVNLTGTPDVIEDEPDVSNASGRTLYVHATRTADQHQAIHDYNLVSGGFFENVPFQSVRLGDPSHGLDDTFLYLHQNEREIVRVDTFEGTLQTVPGTDNFEFVRHPAGSPISNDTIAYAAAVAGSSAIRVNGPGDGATGTNIGGAATYPSWAPDGSFIVYSCGTPLGLCRTEPTPGGTATVISVPGEVVSPVVSPQGDRVAWRDRSGNVWVAGLDGSNATQIANGIAEEGRFGLDWGPDIPLVAAPPAEDPPPPPPADPAPNTPLPEGGADGDPATTDRAAFSLPGPYAAAVSAARFQQAGGGPVAGAFAGVRPVADYVVLSRDDNFADSLAGAPLTARGPLLYTPSDELSDVATAELQRVAAPGRTVYLLGGTAALSDSVEQALVDLGFVPTRLAGPSRFETAVAIAREVLRLGGSLAEVIVARGNGPADNPTAAWADSVTGGAYAASTFTPVVVTPTDGLHPAVEAFIGEGDAQAILLGGTAALSQAVEDALPGSRRIAGDSRADTAAKIATELLGYDVSTARTALLFDVFAEDGWTFGLAAAGLASDLRGALLGVQADAIPSQTAALLATCGDPRVETLILGYEGKISAGVAAEVDRLDGGECT